MAAFLIIQECVVLLVAALLGLLWWSTRESSKRHQDESERRAEVLRRVTLAYGATKAEVEQWRRLALRIDYCPVAPPTPADYAAVNGSGKPPKRRQRGPWRLGIDEPIGVVQPTIADMRRSKIPGTRTVMAWRVDFAHEWTATKRRPYGERAHVSTRFTTVTDLAVPGDFEVVVILCGVPAPAELPDFDDLLGDLETSGGWYHVPPHSSGNKAAAYVAAAQLRETEAQLREMEGNDRG